MLVSVKFKMESFVFKINDDINIVLLLLFNHIYFGIFKISCWTLYFLFLSKLDKLCVYKKPEVDKYNKKVNAKA